MIEKPCKFFSSRKDTAIDMIVVHYLSAVYYNPARPYDPDTCVELLNKEEVSYHYMIDRLGNSYKLVDESQKAWHAGEAVWKKATNINSRSIGIMFIGKDQEKFTSEQFDKGFPFIKEIVQRRAIKEDMLIGHEHIAAGRKIDPGRYFDYLGLYNECYGSKMALLTPQPAKPLSSGKDRFNLFKFLFMKGG